MRKPVRDPYGAVRIAPSKRCRKDPMPVGTVVIRRKTDGRKTLYERMVKVRMDGPPQKRWMSYARWWWEENRGPVPPGKIVLHKDLNSLNDAPENIILGTPGDKLRLKHEADPAWSKAQHRRCGAATAEHNRLRSEVFRVHKVRVDCWYPVLDSVGVILNVPFRKRKGPLRWFGVDVSSIPASGHGKHPGTALARAISASPVRPVAGRDVEKGILSTYLRVDPKTRVACGRNRMAEDDERRIEITSQGTVWKRAEEALEIPVHIRGSAASVQEKQA